MNRENYEFGNMDREVTKKTEQRENQQEQLDVYTELAIKIHELYYKRLLSKKETKTILAFLKEEEYGRDDHKTMDALRLIQENNEYESAQDLLNLAKQTQEDNQSTNKEESVSEKEIKLNYTEEQQSKINGYHQQLVNEGMPEDVVSKFIKEGESYLFGAFPHVIKPDETINELDFEEIIGMAELHARSYRNHIKLEEVIDLMPEATKKIVENTYTSSGGDQSAMTLDKINMAKDIINSLQQEGEDSEELQSVYYGSGDDIELPMLANLKNINMVDPKLTAEAALKIVDRIRKIYDAEAILDEKEQLLSFVYNEKEFSIQLFGMSMEEFNENTDRQFDIAITFNKTPWMTKKELTKRLQKNGILFDNRDFYDEEGPDFSNMPNTSQF